VLNALLHEIVTHLPIPSEARTEELHAMVDAAAPEAETADAPAADTGTPGVTVDTKAK
jgi:hypothetical protein